MKITLNLQDDVLEAASAYAAARQMNLGDAVSELVRRGIDKAMEQKVRVKGKNGLWIFQAKKNPAVPKLTAKQVKALIDDDT